MAEEHKLGEMDISEQEETFNGFIAWIVRVAVILFVIGVFLAVFWS